MSVMLFVLASFPSQLFVYDQRPDPGMEIVGPGTARECPRRLRGFNCAAAAFNRGDMRTTIEQLQIAASKGDARAMKALGLMLRGGIGVPADRELGEYWLRRAAAER